MGLPSTGALPCLSTSACAAASRATTAAAMPAFLGRLLCWGEADADAGEGAWPCEVGELAGVVCVGSRAPPWNSGSEPSSPGLLGLALLPLHGCTTGGLMRSGASMRGCTNAG